MVKIMVGGLFWTWAPILEFWMEAINYTNAVSVWGFTFNGVLLQIWLSEIPQASRAGLGKRPFRPSFYTPLSHHPTIWGIVATISEAMIIFFPIGNLRARLWKHPESSHRLSMASVSLYPPLVWHWRDFSQTIRGIMIVRNSYELTSSMINHCYTSIVDHRSNLVKYHHILSTIIINHQPFLQPSIDR